MRLARPHLHSGSSAVPLGAGCKRSPGGRPEPGGIERRERFDQQMGILALQVEAAQQTDQVGSVRAPRHGRSPKDGFERSLGEMQPRRRFDQCIAGLAPQAARTDQALNPVTQVHQRIGQGQIGFGRELQRHLVVTLDYPGAIHLRDPPDRDDAGHLGGAQGAHACRAVYDHAPADGLADLGRADG